MDEKNFYEMFMKAQNMIKSGNVPPEIQSMMKNGNIPSEMQNMMKNGNSNDSSNSNRNNNSSSGNINNINNGSLDINTMMNIQKMMSMLNSKSDDDLTNLLFALKPYLRNEKKEKIDEYVKLFRMGKMAELWNKMNGQK